MHRNLYLVLIFLLSVTAWVGTVRGEGSVSTDNSEQERQNRAKEIGKALEKAEDPKNQEQGKSVVGDTGTELTGTENNGGDIVKEKNITSRMTVDATQAPEPDEAKKEPSENADVPEVKKTPEPAQPSEEQKKPAPKEKSTEPPPEESRFEYTVLENFNWESSEKKIILRLLVSGESTPTLDVTRDLQGMKVHLRPKGLATRLPRVLSGSPPGVQSSSIQEDPKLAAAWGLEAPYYAVDEIDVSFALPVQYSFHQEPGVLKITFLLPKKIEPKKIEPAPTPSIDAIVSMQREALVSPEITMGTSYQSEKQLESSLLYGAQKPPSIADLYKKELATEFKATSGLPDNVRPIFDAAHPSFGTAAYFKKYVHGNIRQTLDFASNFNNGRTSAFTESPADRAAPERGKNIGNIIGTPAVALLFYHPGTFDVSTGYSASKDFPMTNNNFVYGLDRQNINIGVGHYSDKQFAFTVQNNLRLFGGMTRQKIDGKWIKAPLRAKEGYQLDNRLGLNYRLSKRLLWGGGAGMQRTRSETQTPGGRSRDLLGDLNTYFKYRVTSRLNATLGTDFTHVFKDTGGNDNTLLTGPSTIRTTKGKNVQTVHLSADYRLFERVTLTGTFQGNLIDWGIAKVGGAAGITYRRTPHDDLSFQYRSSVIQNSTGLILASVGNLGNSGRIQLQRYEAMSLRYNRQFDRIKTKGYLEVSYLKKSPLSGVYNGSSTSSVINYDIRFIASIRRAIWKNRAWLGLLYSYEYAPNKVRDYASGEHDFTSNTSQDIIATMEYQF